MIYSYVNGLVSYAIEKDLIKEEDKVYATNRVLALLKVLDYVDEEKQEGSLEVLLKGITDYAVLNGLINDSITERDIFDTELMAIFTIIGFSIMMILDVALG